VTELIQIDSIREQAKNDAPGTYLFVDLETGGLNAERHSILQVAAVITDLNLKVNGYFMTYVKPHTNLETTAEALVINQLNLQELALAPEEFQVVQALSHFASLGGQRPRFAGYNCKFDLLFLDEMWKRHGNLAPPYRVPWLDVLDVLKIKAEIDPPLANFKLATVANHLGIDTRAAHDAGADLMITIEVAQRLKAMPDRNNGAVVLETARF